NTSTGKQGFSNLPRETQRLSLKFKQGKSSARRPSRLSTLTPRSRKSPAEKQTLILPRDPLTDISHLAQTDPVGIYRRGDSKAEALFPAQIRHGSITQEFCVGFKPATFGSKRQQLQPIMLPAAPHTHTHTKACLYPRRTEVGGIGLIDADTQRECTHAHRSEFKHAHAGMLPARSL
uniref:Uncharacterized protein n=1 Tax=Scleropages formosus TaxID=113540 RepID=A0A8C9RB82_SCLFO